MTSGAVKVTGPWESQAPRPFFQLKSCADIDFSWVNRGQIDMISPPCKTPVISLPPWLDRSVPHPPEIPFHSRIKKVCSLLCYR